MDDVVGVMNTALQVLAVADAAHNHAEDSQPREACHLHAPRFVDGQQLDMVGLVDRHCGHRSIQFFANGLGLIEGDLRKPDSSRSTSWAFCSVISARREARLRRLSWSTFLAAT